MTMSTPNQLDDNRLPNNAGEAPVFAILVTIGLCHLLNDIIGGLVPALYPLFKRNYNLTFSQIGLITLTYQIASSLLQPLVGFYTDRRPRPFSLMAGMAVTLGGLIWLSRANSFHTILVSATAVGVGSAVFHPESSRVARLASGGQHGLAQSIFQVGGNFGFSLGPLLAAFIVIGRGQRSIAWFSIDALLAMILLFIIGSWYRRTALSRMKTSGGNGELFAHRLPPAKSRFRSLFCSRLIFSKYIYMSSITSYYIAFEVYRRCSERLAGRKDRNQRLLRHQQAAGSGTGRATGHQTQWCKSGCHRTGWTKEPQGRDTSRQVITYVKIAMPEATQRISGKDLGMTQVIEMLKIDPSAMNHTSVCGHRLLALNHGWNLNVLGELLTSRPTAGCPHSNQ